MKERRKKNLLSLHRNKKNAVSLFIIFSLLFSSLPFTFAQTRPRRVEGENKTQQAVGPIETASQPIVGPTEILSQPSPLELKSFGNLTRLNGEPVVRIGLATNASAVNVSTSTSSLNASILDAQPTVLETSRVRVEAKSLKPINASEGATFQIEIAEATREDAETIARDAREQTNEQTTIAQDEKGNWRVSIGEAKPTQAEAEELRARLDLLGFDTATIVVKENAAQTATVTGTGTNTTSSAQNSGFRTPNSEPRTPNSSPVRPISSTAVGPLREVAVYGANAKLLGTPAPVSFGSEGMNAPVNLNGKLYRGRIEVFANTRGALTVVNVLKMEDYVRGVVPNELSPGGYPQLEALKAQAIAARTYAVKNLGQFASQGFDLLPTTRSQVYRGVSSEHPLTTRAVEETRGVIATYNNEPINALYTSTCGGRTEDVENIFNESTPYLRGRECSIEAKAQIAPYTFKTTREMDIKAEGGPSKAREAALLAVHGFQIGTQRITDAWLFTLPTTNEIRALLSLVAIKSQQPMPAITDDITRPPAFYTALAQAVYGESRADTLLDTADVEYLLPIRDAGEIPAQNRADVAMFLRDEILSLYPDASIRPREQMPRWFIFRAIARLLESKNLFQIQKAAIYQTKDNKILLRAGGKTKDQNLNLSADAYLFRVIGDNSFPVRSVALMGGESVLYHANTSGQVDFLEARPAKSGASAERMSPFTNWTKEMSLGTAQAYLHRWSKGIGTLIDLRVKKRGFSRRVVDLELVGTNGASRVRGGVIRSALRLREQLFVIDRHYNSEGRVVGFTFTGRGWGHGVGLCQVGAYGMAKLGLSYDKILKAYYTGIDLTKMY
jgi:stage II sporulation protein D